MKNWPLLRALHGRGENTSTLAARLGTARTHVSQVLNNDPGRGHQTRPRLAKLLTPEELALAGWDAQGKQLHPVPQGTKSQLKIPVKTDPFQTSAPGKK